MNSLGIDVSGLDTKMEAQINWYTARLRGVSWATIRKSYGLSQDPMFNQNAMTAQAQNVMVMPYHYYVLQMEIFLHQLTMVLDLNRSQRM